MPAGPATTLAPDRLPVEAVYITPEFKRRPPRRINHRRQLDALQDLAERLVVYPEAVLPRFVTLAMELAGGSSAGLSLFEPEPSPGVFRWHHLSGKLKPFEGATTPRDFSPCGVTLDRNGATLASHPERAYDWIAVENLVIPEVLLVPLYIGTDEPLGTLWIVAEKAGHFRPTDARIAAELARFVGMALHRLRVEEQLRAAIAEQQLLAREMSHRVKNVYALTESMVRLTAKAATCPASMADALSGRLHALADAHALVRRDTGASASYTTDLGELISALLRPHDLDSRVPRVTLDGPPVACGPHGANGLALILHELTTNAVKYGALSVSEGRIAIDWSLDDGLLTLHWRETDGPPIPGAPDTVGFGTTLSHRMIERQFGGTIDQQWLPSGLVCTITVRQDRIQA